MADPLLSTKASWRWPDVLLALCGLALACSVHGAIPGWMLPVHLQMLWSGGFAESLAHQGWLALYANDFGAPSPAPIAFGLSGVLPMAALIRLGLAMPDAYAMTVMLWLVVAFGGAASLAARLGTHRRTAILLATCWLTLPMVWGHAGYSMLALGIALLPTYSLMTLSLLQAHGSGRWAGAARAVLAMLVAFVAVFMDGYTFVMYGVGSLCLIALSALPGSEQRQSAVWTALATQLVSLSVAYLAYKRYVGGLPFDPGSLDTFRAFGLDLHYLVVPTQGLQPVFDFFGWSSARSQLDQFGDTSVWTTTFALPLVVLAGVAWLDRGGNSRLVIAIGAIAVVSMYFSLGPSLKVLSAGHFAPGHIASGHMPASAGWIETGNAWISRTLPGFSSMRAAYRWTALSLCCLWMLIAVWMGRRWSGRQTVPMLLLATVIALQVPDLSVHWQTKRGLRAMFLTMDQAVAQDMGVLGLKDERTVLLPTGNDFLVNHIAARYRLKAYNIGGDKNLELARDRWPASIRRAQAHSGPGLALEVRNILLRGDADAVVLPHVGLIEAAFEWPCEAQSPLARFAPWRKPGQPGRTVEDNRLRVAVPIDARHNEHATYLLRTHPDTHAPLPALSLRSAPAGAVLQQRLASGRWETVSSVRLAVTPEARLLLATPPACRTRTCTQEVSLGWSEGAVAADEVMFTNIGPECPEPMREALRPVLQELRADPAFEVREAAFFSVVRPAPRLRAAGVLERNAALAELLSFPLRTNSAEPRQAMVLLDGWHDPEPGHVWSTGQATLSLPVPSRCKAAACEVLLEFFAFGASPAHPVSVTATHVRTGAAVTWHLPSGAGFVGRLPLDGGAGVDEIRLSVPQATSPRQQGISGDARKLGIALGLIDIRSVPSP
ncbi:hypothetical protein [Hydrogenophaga sp. MI9]|uniref:hypothetical protein n=1 Tax=Hydrogenophaga sp. MI9 TaxID=3453719 RepID=UPI003EEA4E30